MVPQLSVAVDREVMSQAVNFNNVQFVFLEPHMHGACPEVGSGIWNLIWRVVAREDARSLTCFETDILLADAFSMCVGTSAREGEAHLHEEDAPPSLLPGQFDMGFSSNGSEYMKDGRFSLATVRSALSRRLLVSFRSSALAVAGRA